MKPTPAGIISLSKGVQETASDIDEKKQSWSSTCVSGVRIGVPWGSIETARNKFDFAIIDKALDLAAKNDKLLALTIKMGYFAPQWVYDEGAQAWTAVSGPDMGTMPLPWDKKYLELVKEFTTELAAHIDANSALGYLQMQGFAQSGELYCANSEPDNQNLLDLGGIPAWLDAAQKITKYFMKAFQETRMFVALSKPFLYKEGEQAEIDFTEWGRDTYPKKFGVQCNSLKCASDVGYYPNEAVSKYDPSGFQMVCGASDVERMGGTLEQAIDNGIRIFRLHDYTEKGKHIEVYYKDVQNAELHDMLASKNKQLLAQ